MRNCLKYTLQDVKESKCKTEVSHRLAVVRFWNVHAILPSSYMIWSPIRFYWWVTTRALQQHLLFYTQNSGTKNNLAVHVNHTLFPTSGSSSNESSGVNSATVEKSSWLIKDLLGCISGQVKRSSPPHLLPHTYMYLAFVRALTNVDEGLTHKTSASHTPYGGECTIINFNGNRQTAKCSVMENFQTYSSSKRSMNTIPLILLLEIQRFDPGNLFT